MNTPAHAVLNLLVLGRRDRPRLALPVLAGALLPDLPIVVFYAWEKLVRGTPEAEIWSRGYYAPAWQAFFDLPNSLPLALLGALVAWRLAAPRLVAFFTSIGLHALSDLPLHYDDAHRHFFPFSDWRFESPVSYWDPARSGNLFAPLEALFVVAGCAVLARRYPSRRARLGIGALVGVYVLYWAYAVWVWVL